MQSSKTLADRSRAADFLHLVEVEVKKHPKFKDFGATDGDVYEGVRTYYNTLSKLASEDPNAAERLERKNLVSRIAARRKQVSC